MRQYTVIGIMSGTSLDGLDVALCTFNKPEEKWKYKIIHAQTYPYSADILEKLKSANNLNAFDFIKLHNDYGEYIGSIVNLFLQQTSSKIDFIASHGHTIFHQPAKSITFQIGSGAAIAAKTGITTISDFRTLDVLLGGQGAPLVPVGDMHLFSDHDYCINLGGFANISYQLLDKRVAYDICPVNIICNALAEKCGKEFDKDGELAIGGKLNIQLFNELNSIRFYHKDGPKSLSREWLTEEFTPIINKYNIQISDLLKTIYEHIAFQIYRSTKSEKIKSILFTGGGSYNKYLMEMIRKHNKNEVVIPDNQIIDFKEALIFAFLGVLRFRNEINCLASVTGSRYDNIGGIIHHIKQ